MKRLVPIVLCLVMITMTGFADAKTIAARGDPQRLHIEYYLADQSFTSTSSSSTVLYKEQAGPDTFAIYGGPGALTGKFSDANGVIPDWQGWTGFDYTDNPVFWQVSTYKADNLNSHGATNNAFWCGQSAVQASGWTTPPGYGNNWNDIAIYESDPVANPAAGQIVTLNFVFNHDTEPGYDYFNVEYDSAGTWVNVLQIDGTNKVQGVFPAPGISYQNVALRPISFDGGDYGFENRIRIRLRVASDSGWSDQDGFWPTDGAVQLDDITLSHSGVSFSEDFEGAGPYLFKPDKFPFVGDFSDVYARVSDPDPCRSNTTPVVAFVDRNQIVRNGPGIDGSIQTGGAISPNWEYGIPGGWVVTYDGGLSKGLAQISNTVRSPEIDWDVPGTGDDDPSIVGAGFTFTALFHGPVRNGIFIQFAVRSRTSTGQWSAWRDRNTLYYAGEIPVWGTFGRARDVTDLLVQGPQKVQVEIGIQDYSTQWGYPGDDATPAPFIDNVRVYKYRIAGPSIALQSYFRANDGFPVNGSIAASTPAERDALDIPFDTANDTNAASSTVIVPGDSVTVDIAAVIPGTSVTDLRMKWALRKNPYFEDAIRSAPSRVKDQNVVATGPIWTGEVVADTTKNTAGAVIRGRFFVDLPDVDFLYPGDQLHYYIQATDSGGRTSTLPANIAGFGVWDSFGASTYSRVYRVNGLPSLTATGQPRKLVYNDAFEFHYAGDRLVISTMGQLGFTEGVDYDVYQVQAPSSFLSNGIGSSGYHGATADQLAGYDTIIVLWESLNTGLLSDGAGTGENDKADDIETMQGWKNLPGQRNTVYFGDYAIFGQKSSAGLAYTQIVMGVQYNDLDARDEIGDQTAPRVRGLLPAFDTQFVAFGGCPTINQFDSIVPLPVATAGHAWVSPNGTNYASPVASVVYDRQVEGYRKVDITFPFGLSYIHDDLNIRGGSLSSRSELFSDVFTYFNVAPSGPNVTSAPPIQRAELSIVPNPFNPKTTIKFAVPSRGDASVKVYSLRGELVRTLHTGELDVGEHPFIWDGTDDGGHSVSSGVYLVNAITGKVSLSKKAVIVR